MLRHSIFIYGMLLGIAIGLLGYPFIFNKDKKNATEVKSNKEDTSFDFTATPSFAPQLLAHKTNVFYVGVDNPISVMAPGVVSTDLIVESSNEAVAIEKKGAGRYNVRPSNVGFVEIKVSNGEEEEIFKFRAKRIPDPIPNLPGVENGEIGKKILMEQKGLLAEIIHFDFAVNCNVVDYEIIYSPENGSKKVLQNSGAAFSEETLALIKEARTGDHLSFTKIKCKCSEDIEARNISSLTARIR